MTIASQREVATRTEGSPHSLKRAGTKVADASCANAQAITLREPLSARNLSSVTAETIAKLSTAEARARIPYTTAANNEVLPIALQSTSNGEEILIALVSSNFDEVQRLSLRSVVNGELLIEAIDTQLLYAALELAYRLDAETRIRESPECNPQTIPNPAELLRRLLASAELLRSSDIHLRRYGKQLDIRFRIDGRLVSHDSSQQLSRELSGESGESFIRYLRQLSGCDITKSHLPGEGAFEYQIDSVPLRVRTSFIPTDGGSTNVLRVLRNSTAVAESVESSLLSLGLLELQVEVLSHLIHRERGAIISCGPTGSGKSTLIAKCIQILAQETKKIVTIEDPVEYRYPLVEQIDLSRLPGTDVDSILPLVLRQDPDVIVVGEIRTSGSAKLSLEAAATGHLIFSTLHATTPEEADARLARLISPNEELMEAVTGYIFQRLVPRSCSSCRRTSNVATRLKDLFRINRTFENEGCLRCQFTGIDGRIGMYEISAPLSRSDKPMRFGRSTVQLTSSNNDIQGAQSETLQFFDALREHLKNGNISESIGLKLLSRMF